MTQFSVAASGAVTATMHHGMGIRLQAAFPVCFRASMLRCGVG